MRFPFEQKFRKVMNEDNESLDRPPHVPSELRLVKPPAFQELDLELSSATNGVLTMEDVQSLLEQQRQINRTTQRFLFGYYWLHRQHDSRHRDLSTHVVQHSRQMQIMRTKILELQTTVSDLVTQMSVQSKVTDRLKNHLDATRQLLNNAIVEYRTEMSTQRQWLRLQQDQIRALYSTALTQDLLLDIVFLLMTIYTMRTRLMRFPLASLARVVTRLVGAKSASNAVLKQRRFFLYQLTQFATAYWINKRMRAKAAEYGLYRGLGGWLTYCQTWLAHVDPLRAIGYSSSSVPAVLDVKLIIAEPVSIDE